MSRSIKSRINDTEKINFSKKMLLMNANFKLEPKILMTGWGILKQQPTSLLIGSPVYNHLKHKDPNG